MAIRYNTSVIRDDLILHLDAANVKSYPGTGSTWFDLSGNNNHVTNSGAVFNSAGYFLFNNGNNFEGNGLNMPFGQEITMSCWFYQLGSGVGAPRIVEIYQNGVNSPAASHALAIDSDGSLRCWADESGTSNDRFFQLDDSTQYPMNTWYNYVMTYNGSTARLYMNATQTRSTNISTTGLDQGDNMIIGAISDYAGAYTHTSNYFYGNVACVKIYNRGLTDSEVYRNFQALRGRFGI